MTAGFDDLEDATSEQDSTDDSPAAPRDPSSPETESTTTETESEPETELQDALDRPAFSFDESKQDAIYVTEETLNEFEDTLDFEVKRALRDDNIRDVPKREYHEALLQLGIENPERLAELVKENRR
jgi:hypothetical protein